MWIHVQNVSQAMDYGYHISLGQIMMYNVEMEEKVGRLEQEGLGLLTNKAKELNQITDRQAFLQQYHQIFSLPKKFEFQPHKGDNVGSLLICSQLILILTF